MFGLMEKPPMPGLKAQWSQTFQSLRNRNYRLYVTGQLISQSGTWMQSVALSWVVYKLTNSALALGLVQFASNLPLLLLTYFGGVAADRFNKKRIIILTQWLEITQAIFVTILYFTGHLTVPWLIGMAIYLGICSAFEVPGRQSFIPELVESSEMTNAIGLNSAIMNVSRLIGPMLAGFIIATGGEVTCFIANALSYVAAIITLSKIKTHKAVDMETAESGATDASKRTGTEVAKPTGNGTSDVKAWLMQPHIRNIMLLVAVTSVFGFQYAVLMPVIAVKNLADQTGALLGFLSAGTGVGALIGSLLIASRGNIPWLSRRVGVGGVALGAGIILLAFSHSLPLSLVATSICGLSLSLQLGGSMSLLQLQVPKQLRGRVMSIFSTFMMGLAPFAALIAGWAAQSHGVPLTLGVAAVITAIASGAYIMQSRKA
jgi:MFS family permease